MIDIHELIGRINAMRASEERYARCQNYFAYCSESSDVDASCRKAMANWCFQVADTLSFSHETVGLAMSFFDRYLSSRRGKSQEALDSRNMFQLAAITCFYTAVKTYEPVELGVICLPRCAATSTQRQISLPWNLTFCLHSSGASPGLHRWTS